MKHFISYLTTALVVISMSCTGNAQTKNTTASNPVDRVEVLDFHTDHRCATCLEIEKLTKKILADHYAGEMKSGKITFRLINADDKANAAIVQKFLAYGTTLIVYSIKNGKEEHIDLTSFAFMNFNKADKFSGGLRKELDAALKRIKS